jgi:hypothetical protein
MLTPPSGGGRPRQYPSDADVLVRLGACSRPAAACATPGLDPEGIKRVRRDLPSSPGSRARWPGYIHDELE